MSLKKLFTFSLIANILLLSSITFIISEYNKTTKELTNTYDISKNKISKNYTNNIHKTIKKTHNLEDYASYSIVALILLALFTFYIIVSRIINPLEVLKNTMLEFSQNKNKIKTPTNNNNDEIIELTDTAQVFKQNTIELMKSEQKNKSFLDLAGEGIFGLNKYAQFTFLNPMACKLLGIKNQDDYIGRYIDITILQSTKQHDIQEKLMLANNKEISFLNSNNKSFPIDYVSTPVYNKEGFLDGSVVVFSDNTKRKENEDKLKNAIKNAENANRAKSVFLANMSHELRTPLNAILGFTTLLKKSSNLNKEEKEDLNIISKSGNHLLSIINSILQLSKMQAGKIELKNIDFNLHQCIEEINQMFAHRCKQKDILFNTNIEKDTPKYIHCDRLKLSQIIINLLENAIKFTQKGSIDFNIKKQNKQIVFSIKDTGIGISKENIELIFKAFEQVSQDSNSTQGTGLGLSITKELVNKMGGEINISSQEEKGSTFSFSIDYKLCDKEKIKENTNNLDVEDIKDIKKSQTLIDSKPILKELLNATHTLDANLIKQLLNKHKIRQEEQDKILSYTQRFDFEGLIAYLEKPKNNT